MCCYLRPTFAGPIFRLQVWQITQGYSTDNFGPAPVIPTGLKEKWKTPSKRKARSPRPR